MRRGCRGSSLSDLGRGWGSWEGVFDREGWGGALAGGWGGLACGVRHGGDGRKVVPDRRESGGD